MNPYYVDPTAAGGLGINADPVVSNLDSVASMVQKKNQLEQAQQQKKAAEQEIKQAISSGDSSKLNALMVKYPNLSNAIKNHISITNDQTHELLKSATANVLQTNDPSKAADVLESYAQQVQAAGGNPVNMMNAVNGLRDGSETLNDVKGMMGLMFPDQMQEVRARKQAEYENKLAVGKLKKQGIEISKLDAESQKAVIEAENMKKNGGSISVQDRFNMEKKLRDDYNKRSSNLNESRLIYDRMTASADDGSGQGDIALITGFMKMLDPGSVVRETEFATAQDTGGLYASLQNALTKLEKGALLKNGQRQKYVNLAKKYLDAAQKQEQRVRGGLDKVVKNYGLNPENVFDMGASGTDTAEKGNSNKVLDNKADLDNPPWK